MPDVRGRHTDLYAAGILIIGALVSLDELVRCAMGSRVAFASVTKGKLLGQKSIAFYIRSKGGADIETDARLTVHAGAGDDLRIARSGTRLRSGQSAVSATGRQSRPDRQARSPGVAGARKSGIF